MRLAQLLCALVFWGVTPAMAQVVGDPEAIRLMMTEFGLPVTPDKDSTGDPKLESRIDGTHFTVYFYDCDKAMCGAIQFSAGFDMDQPLSAERVNDWNRGTRFGKVYLDDESDPFVVMDVELGPDGIGRKNFDSVLDTWRVVLSDFRSFINW